jgi:TRAP-type transport system periplasmic protein
MKVGIPVRLIAAASALLTAVVGCSSTAPDRAGGNLDTPATVLTLAEVNDSPPAQLTAWIKAVQDLSHGSIRIELKNLWHVDESGNEVQTIRDVERGKADMAWVGARVMDRVGVTSFQALLAPMLVDSYDLETSVFQDGIPAQMVAGVEAAGVVGIGVLPGPMRKVMGIAKPFLTPTDFAGARIADQDSALTQLTLHTLGATAVPVPGGAKLRGVDGYEQQLESIAGNRYDTVAKFTTANLNLGRARW